MLKVNQLIGFGAGGEEAFDVTLADLTYQGTYSYSGSQALAYCLFVNNAGTKWYLGGTSPDEVQVYTMSTPGDITTSSETNQKTSPTANPPTAVWANLDGDVVIFQEGNIDYLRRWNLSTANDVSTATLHSTKDVSGISSTSQAIWVDETLTYVWACDGTLLREWTMSTPGDLTTLSETDTVLLTGDLGAGCDIDGIWVSEDGLTALIGDQADEKIHKFTMTSPRDLMNMTYTGDYLDVSSYVGASGLTDIGFAEDLKALYVVDRDNDSVDWFA